VLNLLPFTWCAVEVCAPSMTTGKTTPCDTINATLVDDLGNVTYLASTLDMCTVEGIPAGVWPLGARTVAGVVTDLADPTELPENTCRQDASDK
jgi:hypothetical protein